ncbi:hypothetical protein SAMN04489760_11265 [Syntrophus gentianae]|uniref:Uncharacterized protein n=1 Tax=Syntrophus gentianae TaxID=43775 RepID=A0A1H7XXJ5_9BACT|nr:hypothetical protein [Syntrophus gentianae]SEM37797.1 hypothetical protein SAMN04489760_11265 [Syntrophus gentianae]
MTPKTDIEALLARIKELEEENERLRNELKAKSDSELTIFEDEYKGHPVLTLGRSCRPFSIGLRQLQFLKKAWPQVEIFLQKHEKSSSNPPTEDDEIKI